MSESADSKTQNDENGDGRLSDFEYPESTYGYELDKLVEAFTEIGEAFNEALLPIIPVLEYLASEQAKIDAMPFHKRLYWRIRQRLNL